MAKGTKVKMCHKTDLLYNKVFSPAEVCKPTNLVRQL